MIRENSDLKIDSDENFIEAAQLMESHRRPVAWLLAIQITLLGLMLIGLVRPSTIPTVAMFVLLAGFLRYANSVWLTAFLTLVIGARIFQTAIGEEFFIESNLILDSALILLTLVASFRYIELRSYSRTFELSKSYRRLETSNKPSPIYVLHTMMGQLVRRHWYLSLLAIFGAYLLLWSIPTTKQWTQKYWLDPTGGRFIFLGLALFLGWFICRAVFSMWDWFCLTPKQADVAMRSWANREFWSPMAGVERRRSKLRKADYDDD